ncbi:MAG: hypothetical protein ACREHV_00990 [Rhizomicrobium sp.]
MITHPDPQNPERLIGDNGQPYPSLHAPGTHWATDEAWNILDHITPGVIPDDARFLLGGLIAGTLMRMKARKVS